MLPSLFYNPNGLRVYPPVFLFRALLLYSKITRLGNNCPAFIFFIFLRFQRDGERFLFYNPPPPPPSPFPTGPRGVVEYPRRLVYTAFSSPPSLHLTYEYPFPFVIHFPLHTSTRFWKQSRHPQRSATLPCQNPQHMAHIRHGFSFFFLNLSPPTSL